jgi:hypothetical protein
MADLRRLLHHPSVLADDPPPRAGLARTPEIPISHAAPDLDCHVDCHRRTDRPVAKRCNLFGAVDVASRSSPIRHRDPYLPKRKRTLQLVTTRRFAGSSRRKPTAASCNRRNPIENPPSHLSRPSVRNAGLEHRHRPCSLLASDCDRDRDWSRDDSHGGCRTGEEVRRRIPKLPESSPRSRAETRNMICRYFTSTSRAVIIRWNISHTDFSPGTNALSLGK